MAAPVFRSFDSTVANVVADIKTNVLLSSDWANITGNILKTTTTRGAQIVVDLTDAAITTTTMQLGIYRTHDGTTGVDKLTRFLRWKQNAGATSNAVHVEICAWKEGIYIAIEGARGGETNAEDSTYGSYKQCLVIADIVPYFAGDTIPAVCLVSHNTNATNDHTGFAYVSRNQGNNASWVPARLASLHPVSDPTQGSYASAMQPVAKGDGNYYVWPYVVVESADGLRGRLNMVFFAGYDYPQTQSATGEPNPQTGASITYGGNTYRLVCPFKGLQANNSTANPLGNVGNGGTTTQYAGPIIAVPTA